MLLIRLTGLAHLAGSGRGRRDFYILAGDGISRRSILAHANLRIGAVADIPSIKLRIRCGVDGHISCISGIDGAIVNGYPRYAHGRAGRSHLDVTACAVSGLRGNIRCFDDQHAALLRLIRLRLAVCAVGGVRNFNLPAVRKNLCPFRRCIRLADGEIVMGAHGDVAAMRLDCPSGHLDVIDGKKENAVTRHRGVRGALDAGGIHQIISVGVHRGELGRILKHRPTLQQRRGANIDILGGNRNALRRMNGAINRNRSRTRAQ